MGAIGLTGTKAKNSEGVMGEGYTMTIGGSQGANPTVGEIHRKAIPADEIKTCLLYTSPSPRDATLSRMPSSA